MTAYRIVVLGGGYTGIVAAQQLARRTRSDQTSVILVTDAETREERMRWHQLAAGQRYPTLPIADALRRSRVTLRIASIERIDPDRRTVHLHGGDEIDYDSLVIALGSTIDFGTVEGARENAHSLTGVDHVRTAARQLEALPDGAPGTVVGGGLTGIELVTELAESHPRLRFSIVSPRAPGDWMSAAAQRHLARVLDRLGVEHVSGRVDRIDADAVRLADGRDLRSALTFWAGGFRANPLVAASGLDVDEVGRARVDGTFRSASHPDVRVIGDAARVPGPDGEPLKMGCRTGAFMALAAPQLIAAQLSGAEVADFDGRYYAECVSLGRHDALLQWLTPEGAASDRIITGRPAVWMKEFIQTGTRIVARHPGPYLPVRRARIESSSGSAHEARQP